MYNILHERGITMTEEELKEKSKELKMNEIALKALPPTELFLFGSSILFDAKFVKEVYETCYMNHIDLLNQPISRVYMMFIILSTSSYVGAKFLTEFLKEDTKKIETEINNYQKVKKLF